MVAILVTTAYHFILFYHLRHQSVHTAFRLRLTFSMLLEFLLNNVIWGFVESLQGWTEWDSHIFFFFFHKIDPERKWSQTQNSLLENTFWESFLSGTEHKIPENKTHSYVNCLFKIIQAYFQMQTHLDYSNEGDT